MRVSFILLRRGYVRNFAACIEGLLARGHEVHLGFDESDRASTGIEERLAQRYGRITWDAVSARRDRWSLFLFGLRGMIDLVRYYHPDYRGAPALQQRINKKAGRHLGRSAVLLQWLFAARSARWVRLTIKSLTWLQFKFPVAKESRLYLEEKAPDVLIVTPLVNFLSYQVDHIQAADALGIPTIAAIASWDNLTNKGLLRCRPDRVLLWNRPQQLEAERYHYIPPSNIVATGAHTFDRWLGRKPLRSREAFLARVGLERCDGFLAFVCSSSFISRQEEVSFVRQWVAAIRNSADARIRELGIIIRPHFQNADQWAGVELSDLGNVVVYPRGGANPVDAESEADFFDTLYYSHAVVGVNTTAMIEAGVIGRPVMTIETDQFGSTQSGSLHFKHLRDGGLLKYANTMEAHLEQIRETLDQPSSADANQAFIDYFIRPPDGSTSAVERFIDEIEAVAAMKKAPVRPGWTARPIQATFYPVAGLLRTARRRHRRIMKQTSGRDIDGTEGVNGGIAEASRSPRDRVSPSLPLQPDVQSAAESASGLTHGLQISPVPEKR